MSDEVGPAVVFADGYPALIRTPEGPVKVEVFAGGASVGSPGKPSLPAVALYWKPDGFDGVESGLFFVIRPDQAEALANDILRVARERAEDWARVKGG
jgi:hypothetical protein